MNKERLSSLDAFRGYTVAAMIMVNFPGSEASVFFTLKHTIWNGLSFTDQVAPYFLFIIGVSIHLAYWGRSSGEKPALYRKIIFRALKIYAIGMFLNAMPAFNMNELRWTGTLHRIALVFLICAFLELNSGWKGQLGLLMVLLLGYWMAMTLIPTPGLGHVALEPGQNLAAWVDSKYLPGKMWQGTWDPEGILTTIPTVATCILGMLVGRLIRTEMPLKDRLLYLFSTGVGLAIMGYFLGLAFPVNENLWTSSFVLVTGGFACLIFGVFSFLIDVLKRDNWAQPGIIFGKNAIAAYVLGDLLSLIFFRMPVGGSTLNQLAVQFMSRIGFPTPLASWFYALFFVAIVFIPCSILYRKKIFIKV